MTRNELKEKFGLEPNTIIIAKIYDSPLFIAMSKDNKVVMVALTTNISISFFDGELMDKMLRECVFSGYETRKLKTNGFSF